LQWASGEDLTVEVAHSRAKGKQFVRRQLESFVIKIVRDFSASLGMTKAL